MTLDLPPVTQPHPGVLVVHYEWPDHLGAAWQSELLEKARAAADGGAVALVFVLAERLREIPPSVRGFWRTTCSDPGYRIAALAVVTRSWAVEVGAAGLGVTSALSGDPLAVRSFAVEAKAVAWAAAMARPAPLAAPA